MKNAGNNKVIVASIILGVSILVGSYSIALGNRYIELDQRLIFDKWTKKFYNIRGGEYQWKLGESDRAKQTSLRKYQKQYEEMRGDN